MRNFSPFATILAVATIALTAAPVPAADNGEPWWTPTLRSKDLVDGGTGSRVDDPAAGPPASEPAPPPAPAPPAAIVPDRPLTKTIELVRRSAIGGEPNVTDYLDRITAGRASGAQVNDFAAYVAKRGMPKVAIAFQQYALRLQPQDSTLWLNLGTLQRAMREFRSAEASFKKAIALDPLNALAHYNLGAVYDARRDYDDAIEEYRRALVLDPSLSDPRKNPQVVNNENMLSVELAIYQSQAGALGLPLLQMQKNAPPQTPAAGKK